MLTPIPLPRAPEAAASAKLLADSGFLDQLLVRIRTTEPVSTWVAEYGKQCLWCSKAKKMVPILPYDLFVVDILNTQNDHSVHMIALRPN